MSPLVHREARPAGAPAGTLVCLHGYPESSYMWRHVLEAAAQAGWRAVAPDFNGYGDSPYDGPATWERHVADLDEFVARLDEDEVVLCVHDWGGLIGLRWATELGQDRVRALIISDSGFFPDGKWHGMAKVLRTEGDGEAALAAIDRDGFAAMMRSVSPGIDDAAIAEYWRGYEGEDRRRGHLEMYRSGDFEKLEGHDLAALGVPVLLLWGADDPFAPIAGAHRFQRELPDTRLHVVEGTGHFVFDDAPDEAARAVVEFLATL